MASIVLVHGAWGGSYGFRRLRPLLTAHGHDVFTPSLTGIGERSHLVSEMASGITLSTHIGDVSNTLFYEDLSDIVMLGFSYGGMVVTGLLDDFADKINHLIYLDAVVPQSGQSAADALGPFATVLLDGAENGAIAPLPRQLETPEATAWSEARRSNQPIGTFTEPVRLEKSVEDHDLTRTFVKATADPGESPDSAFWKAARHAEVSPAWNYHEIATNHMVPMTRPKELAQIILDVASGTVTS